MWTRSKTNFFPIKSNGPIVVRYIAFIFAFGLNFVWSQSSTEEEKTKKIVLRHANTLEYNEKSGIKAQRLIGDVEFEHEGALMFCDSAYLYKEKNSLDAFGHVKIINETGETIYGDSLFYDGNIKKARLRGEVRMEEEKQTLVTNYVDYNLKEDLAYYLGGGTLTNHEDSSVLVSEYGYYFTKKKEFFFKKNVVLTHPDYTIKSDTMMHQTEKDITYYLGPTTITDSGTYIYCEYGWFDQKSNYSKLEKNATIHTDGQILSGDSILYDKKNALGEAFSCVSIEDTAEKVVITGEYGFFNEKDSFTLITQEALLTQYYKDDTLYLHGDTLSTIQDSSKGRITLAYHKVKFYKNDFQGMCDSLVMVDKDSLIFMYSNPVLWTDSNEMKSDTIIIKQAGGTIEKIYFNQNAFIISMLDSSKFNQIAGKSMEGFFKKNELHKINVYKDAQTLYYPEDKKDYIGINKATSENLTIFLKNSDIKTITFRNPNESSLFPLDNPNNEPLFLANFKWLNTHRPGNSNEIFSWSKIK